jgi:hypothetical protein
VSTTVDSRFKPNFEQWVQERMHHSMAQLEERLTLYMEDRLTGTTFGLEHIGFLCTVYAECLRRKGETDD